MYAQASLVGLALLLWCNVAHVGTVDILPPFHYQYQCHNPDKLRGLTISKWQRLLPLLLVISFSLTIDPSNTLHLHSR